MTLVIGLHSPVFGYCAAGDVVIVGPHLIDSVCNDDCDHESEPTKAPCQDEHEFVTLDPGDFQWSPLALIAPPMALVPEDFDPVVCPFFVELPVPLSLISYVDPPPPDTPIFRRDAALRL